MNVRDVAVSVYNQFYLPHLNYNNKYTIMHTLFCVNVISYLLSRWGWTFRIYLNNDNNACTATYHIQTIELIFIPVNHGIMKILTKWIYVHNFRNIIVETYNRIEWVTHKMILSFFAYRFCIHNHCLLIISANKFQIVILCAYFVWITYFWIISYFRIIIDKR